MGYKVLKGTDLSPEDVFDRNRGSRRLVFWTKVGVRRAFSDDGKIVGTLQLFWKGDPEQLCLAIDRVGLFFRWSGMPDRPILLVPREEAVL